jgi:hypothetical protein
MRSAKSIPHGFWYFFEIAPQTTEEQIADNFNRVGIPLTLDRVTVFLEERHSSPTALVSLSDDVFMQLLKARLDKTVMNGKPIILRPSKANQKRRQHYTEGKPRT